MHQKLCRYIHKHNNLILQHKTLPTNSLETVTVQQDDAPEERRRDTFVPLSLRLVHLVVPLFSVCSWAPLQHTFISIPFHQWFCLGSSCSHCGRRSSLGSADDDPPLLALLKLRLYVVHTYKAAGFPSLCHLLSISCSLTRGERSPAQAEAQGRVWRALKKIHSQRRRCLTQGQPVAPHTSVTRQPVHMISGVTTVAAHSW